MKKFWITDKKESEYGKKCKNCPHYKNDHELTTEDFSILELWGQRQLNYGLHRRGKCLLCSCENYK